MAGAKIIVRVGQAVGAPTHVCTRARSPCAFRHGRVARAARLPAPARAGNFVYSLAHVVLHHTIFLDFKFFYQFSRLNVAVQSTIFLETKQVLADQQD
jgi:hypothetical protein